MNIYIVFNDPIADTTDGGTPELLHSVWSTRELAEQALERVVASNLQTPGYVRWSGDERRYCRIVEWELDSPHSYP